MTSYSDIARSDLKQKVVIAAGSSTANTLMLLGIGGENGGSIDAMDSAFNVVSAAKLMR
jgi:putative spermidine/putrescine transport system substrate-binding protein